MNDLQLTAQALLSIANAEWEDLKALNSHRWHDSYKGQFKNVNGLVQLRGCIENTLSNKKDVIIAQIPEPEKNAPTILTTVTVPLMSAEVNDQAKIEIGKNGVIKVLNVTAGKNIYLNTIIYMR